MPDRPEPHHGTAPSQGVRDDIRTDAAGFDTQPTPAPPERQHPNRGNSDGPAPEDEGWTDPAVAADAPWQGDVPYPDEDPNASPPPDLLRQGPETGDPLAAAAAALDGLDGLDPSDLSVEIRGDTAVLRGTAATAADARQAEAALLQVPGIARVENLLAAAPPRDRDHEVSS